MTKNISEGPNDSKERKSPRKNENETIDPNGKKTTVEETLFDDHSSSKTPTIHDTEMKSSTENVALIDDAKTKTETSMSKLKNEPEIIKYIHPPLKSHSAKSKQVMTSREEILEKKKAQAKPEIVTDRRYLEPTITNDHTDFDTINQEKQPSDTLTKDGHPNNINYLEETVNQEPNHILSTISTRNENSRNNIDDIEDFVDHEPAPIPPRHIFTHNETVEAYVVSDDSSPNEATIQATSVQIAKEEKHILRSPKKVYKTKYGTVKKRCWVIFVILITICVITGIVVSTTSKSSMDSSNAQDTAPDLDSTPSQSLSFVPSQTPSTQYPSTNPTEIGCNFLCLTEILQSECPNDNSPLKSCHVTEVDDLCTTERPCAANKDTSKCGRAFYVYRKIRCPIDMPWRHASKGFEYYVEILEMDWSSHKQRANQYNASLASIHSQTEMSLIANMTADIGNVNSYYVGGSRRNIVDDPWTNGTEAYWKWTDDTQWDFTAWDSGEPNGQITSNNTRESVVVIRNSRMRDDYSTTNLPAVYKRQKVGNHTQILELPQTLGQFHTCALQNQAFVYCWGPNSFGRLGDGSTTQRLVPTLIDVGDGTTITQLALGGRHSCALLSTGRVKCWGYNIKGQLGDGTTTDRLTPTVINVDNGTAVTQLALGGDHSCALLENGRIKCWGSNSNGQLGDGTRTSAARPIPHSINGDNGTIFTYLALGETHSCALMDNGTVKCWGRNIHGQLGDGTKTKRPIPKRINIDEENTVTQLALGYWHTCALLDNGKVKCWGYNLHGQIGDGSTTERRNPTAINVDDGRAVTQLALGYFHSCALLDNGAIKCWGQNDYGQLGDGSTTTRLNPTVINVGDGRAVTQLALGDYHSCALLDNGMAKCWGRNDFGQLGDGSITNHINASLANTISFST